MKITSALFIDHDHHVIVKVSIFISTEFNFYLNARCVIGELCDRRVVSNLSRRNDTDTLTASTRRQRAPVRPAGGWGWRAAPAATERYSGNTSEAGPGAACACSSIALQAIK